LVYTWADKLFKMLEKCGIWKKKVFWFICDAIYEMPGSHLKGRTLRVIKMSTITDYVDWCLILFSTESAGHISKWRNAVCVRVQCSIFTFPAYFKNSRPSGPLKTTYLKHLCRQFISCWIRNDTLRRFQGRAKGSYIPSETLMVFPRSGAQRSPKGGPQGSREGRNTPIPSLSYHKWPIPVKNRQNCNFFKFDLKKNQECSERAR
jgi:hypothetical protein